MDKIPEKYIFSVSEFLDLLNGLMEGAQTFVRGEVTELKVGSQWVGFTLKDKEDGSLLKCVMGGWDYKRIGVRLEDGMEIKISGTPKVSKKWGSLGYWVKSIEPLGEGSLKKAYELLLKQLTTEGLFARKRPIPEFIERIAVISSRDGVVVHDLRRNLRPLGISIDFFHTNVEGGRAVDGVVKWLEYCSKKACYDAIVIIRGGGSLESLQAFNNELVARAIFGSSTPVIVGIGHEVDVPIACLVADASASTPTAVAHLINSSWDSLLVGLPRIEQLITYSFERHLERLGSVANLRYQSIGNYFERIFDRFNNLERVVKDGLTTIYRSINQVRERVSGIERFLVTVSPERNLKLGYSLVYSKSGKLLRSIHETKVGDSIGVALSDGTLESEVTKI